MTAGFCPHGWWTATLAGGCPLHCDGSQPPTAPLGPLQDVWDAWTPAQEHAKNLTDVGYYRLVCDQLQEIQVHLAHRDTGKAINEMVDLMSVALNWMRKHGVSQPREAEHCIRQRAATRYAGKTADIVARDAELYGYEYGDTAD